MASSIKPVFAFSKSTIGAVRSAFAKAAKIEQSAMVARNAAGQRMVDELLMLCDTADREAFFKKSKARAACTEVFEACENLSESAVRNYPTSVKIAFIHDVPFSASLFTREGQAAAGLDLAPKTEASDKSGAVTKTTMEAAGKTARKLIEQLRLLGQDDAAAGIVDVMLECNPAFTEAADDATI